MLFHVLHEAAQREGFIPDIVFTNDSEVVLQSSVEQLGSVTILPCLGKQAAQDGLAWVPLTGRQSSFPIAIATRRGEPLNREMVDFVNCIQHN